jgi:CHASE3 domain sensor protein
VRTASQGRALILSHVRAPGGTARSKLVQVIISALGTLIVLLVCVVIGLVLARQLIVLARTALSPTATANRAILQAMTDSQSSLRGYQLTRDPAILQPYREAQAPLAAALDSLDAASLGDPEMHRLAAAERATATAWIDDYARHAAAGPVPNSVEQTGNTAFEAFRTSNVDVSTALRTRSYAWLERASWIVLLTLIALVVVLIVGTVLSLVPAFRALRQIGPPLEALETTVDRIRSGDAGARADPTLGVREIQAVSLAVNELAAEHERRQLRDAEDIRVGTAARLVGTAINSSLELAEIGRRSAQAIAEEFGATAVWLRAFEGRGELPGAGLGCIYPADVSIRSRPHLVDNAYRVARLAWERRTHVLITAEAQNSLDFFTPSELEQIQQVVFAGTDLATLVIIPIGVGPDCLGYVAAVRSVERPGWSPPEVEALLAIGRDIGQAIVHARLLERETVLVGELKQIDDHRAPRDRPDREPELGRPGVRPLPAGDRPQRHPSHHPDRGPAPAVPDRAAQDDGPPATDRPRRRGVGGDDDPRRAGGQEGHHLGAGPGGTRRRAGGRDGARADRQQPDRQRDQVQRDRDDRAHLRRRHHRRRDPGGRRPGHRAVRRRPATPLRTLLPLQ